MLYIHENNYISKIRSNYNGKGKEIKEFYENVYLNYKEKLNDIDFSDDNIETFQYAAELMDEYILKVDKFADENGIKSQSKFRSTFIEEISSYLFKDVEPVKEGKLGIFNKGIFCRNEN